MREHLIFAPHGRERLAGAITLPDDEAPRGMVLLLTGLGAARSHQYRLWTDLARRLAGHGLAAVRFDYLGMGDSTGSLFDHGPLDRGSLVDQARSMLSAAKRGTGIQRIAFAGNCIGAQTALEVAAGEHDCAGAVCILPAMSTPGLPTRARNRLRNSQFGAALLRSGTARRLIRTAGRSFGDPIDLLLLRALPAALKAGPVLLLYGERDRRTAPARAAVERSLAKTSQLERVRCEFRSLPGVALEGFDSPESRRLAMDAAEAFLVDRFEETDSRLSSSFSS